MPTSRFFLAAGISLLLHATLLSLFVCWPLPHFGTPADGKGGIDTRAPSVEAIVLLTDAPPARIPAPMPQPASLSKAVEVPPPVRSPLSVAKASHVSPAPVAQSPGPKGTSPGQAAGTTTFFQLKAEGKTIVYVIDCSMSMGRNDALELARNELLASLERLPATARFQVIPYNRNAEPLLLAGRRDLVPATPENKQRAADLIAALHAEGSTDHLKALQRALDLHAEVVFFLTDADDLRAEQIRLITQRNHGHAVIHAIEMSDSSTRTRAAALPLLAQANRGDYRAVSHGH